MFLLMGTTLSFVTRKTYRWDKAFKNRPSNICGRQPLKYLKGYSLLKETISLQFFLPQILLGPFLNTLSQMYLTEFDFDIHHFRNPCQNMFKIRKNLASVSLLCGKKTPK